MTTPKNNRRRRTVIALEQDFDALSPAQFELVCHDFICSLEGRQLIHRGLTDREHPVGHSVDSFDDRGMVVGEFGTAAGYYDDGLEKIHDDIAHAIATEPSHVALYLMANQRCPQKTWREVTKAVRSHYGAAPAVDVRVYDSRRMASGLYDELVIKPQLIDAFSNFLPSLAGFKEDSAFENARPPIPPDYVAREKVQAALDELFQTESIAALSGLSGSGKTYCAIAFSDRTSDRWEQVIWVDGDDVRAGALQGVTVERVGLTVNLQSRLKRSRTLLVIDRWVGERAGLDAVRSAMAQHGHPDARILLTSEQDLSLQGVPSISAHDITQDEVAAILSLNVGTPAPCSLVDRLIELTGGLPLILSILRETVSAGDLTWDECPEVLGEVGDLERDDIRILERILARSQSTLERELHALAFIGTRIVEPHILKQLTSPLAVHKLRKRCLVSAGSNGSLLVHELVLSLARELAHDSTATELELRFWAYFEKHVQRRPGHYVRSIHQHAERLRQKVEAEATPSCLSRAYLDLEESIDSDVIDKLAGTELTSASDWCATACVVEALELQWRRLRGAKEAAARERAGLIEAALDLVSEAEPRSYLLHHAAKFRLFAEDFEGALELLRQCNEDSIQTRLQKARCLRKLKRNGDAHEQLVSAFATIDEDPDAATPVTVIAIYCELRYPPFADLLKTHLLDDPGRFLETITAAIADGNGQPYDAVAVLANSVAYDHPEMLATLSDHIEPPEPSERHRRQNKSVGRMLLTRGVNASYAGEFANAGFIAGQAQAYLDKVIGGTACGSVRDRARCRELQGSLSEALELLESSERPEVFDEHAICRVLLALDRADDAHNRCEQLIKTARETARFVSYLPTFVSLMGDIALARKEPDEALRCWREALAESSSPRFADGLKGKISETEANETPG